KAFGATHNAIFVAPSLYANDFYNDDSVVEIGRVENVMEEYHAIFADSMIQDNAVERMWSGGVSALWGGAWVFRGVVWGALVGGGGGV
ncbi:hypothetical protein NQU33_25715, partial [Escherichia coli]|nr:hypothetical protein [Escherichia coli]